MIEWGGGPVLLLPLCYVSVSGGRRGVMRATLGNTMSLNCPKIAIKRFMAVIGVLAS